MNKKVITRIGKPRGSIVPKLGMSGRFEMQMWRGISEQSNEVDGYKFSSDAGDYGRGEYWAREKSFARIYGSVITRKVALDNALHISPNDIVILAKDIYGTTIKNQANHCRFKASEELTKDMISNGYDGIVVYGYERFRMWSACIFKLYTK